MHTWVKIAIVIWVYSQFVTSCDVAPQNKRQIYVKNCVAYFVTDQKNWPFSCSQDRWTSLFWKWTKIAKFKANAKTEKKAKNNSDNSHNNTKTYCREGNENWVVTSKQFQIPYFEYWHLCYYNPFLNIISSLSSYLSALDFCNYQFEISSLKNWIFFQVS